MLYSHVSYFTFGGIICYELLEINGPSHSHTFKYSHHLEEAILTHKALQGSESGVREEENFLLLVLLFFHSSLQIDIYMRYIHPTYNHKFFCIYYMTLKKKKNYSLHKILSLISYTFRSSTYSFQKLNWTLNTPPPYFNTSFSHY